MLVAPLRNTRPHVEQMSFSRCPIPPPTCYTHTQSLTTTVYMRYFKTVFHISKLSVFLFL